MRRLRWAVVAIAALLSACASSVVTPPPVRPAAVHVPPTLAQTARPRSTALFSVAALPGWDQEDHVAALVAFESGCGVARESDLRALCTRARTVGVTDEAEARSFWEANFQALRVGDQGLLTAYFAPEYPARLRREGDFTAPAPKKPADLIMVDLGLFDASLAGRKISGHVVGDRFAPYGDRAAIEADPPAHADAWMRPEDLFFLQIQGSGVLLLPDGGRLKATYAASNGKPFVGIANALRDRGALADGNTSGDAIHAWLADHRGPDADAVMRLNPRYVFFNLAPDDGREPAGAAGAALIPGRALAVDATRHALGGVYWIDASAPALSGAFPVYRRVALALDTGGAIKGDVRADLYTGRGFAAGSEAGRVRHVLRLYALVPTSSAAP